MRSGETYKHINCLDVGVYVTAIPYRDDKQLKLKVVWVNVKNGIVYGPEKIVIKREDVPKWTGI